jgi:predicted nucleotidyltransferase
VAAVLDFPTPLHQQVARLAHDFFNPNPLVDTVLVVNSCARGQASPESDLDLAVLVRAGVTPHDVQALETTWRSFMTASPVVVEFRESGRFTQVHLDVIDGHFVPGIWDDGGGPDTFEVEIGNRVAYAVPLGAPGDHFQRLQASWLPYYDEDLRVRRLRMVREACAYDLERVLSFVKRGLHFPAFDYLYKAFQEFLQALFIVRRTYPLSYTKWIREQVANRLGLPELYQELPRLLSVRNLESTEVGDKAVELEQLLERWIRG